MRGPPLYWTRDRIIAAIRLWADARGEPPRLADWGRSSPTFPQRGTVLDRFGSWNGAIEAAGFAGRAQGWPRKSTAGARPDASRMRAPAKEEA